MTRPHQPENHWTLSNEWVAGNAKVNYFLLEIYRLGKAVLAAIAIKGGEVGWLVSRTLEEWLWPKKV